MDQIDAIAIAAQIAMGLALAACAGLRAFLPALAVGVAARAGLFQPAPELAWIAGTPALTVLAIAVVAEMAGDKIPVLDHLLDAAGTVLRPALAGLVAMVPILSVLDERVFADGLAGAGSQAWIAGLASLAAGGGIGAGVHLAKAHARLGSTALTGGAANPVLSLFEDALSLLGTLLSLLLPLLAFGIVLTGGILLVLILRRRRAPASQHG